LLLVVEITYLKLMKMAFIWGILLLQMLPLECPWEEVWLPQMHQLAELLQVLRSVQEEHLAVLVAG